MQKYKYIRFSIVILFVLLNTIAIAKEWFIFSYISLAFVVLYLLIYRVDILAYGMALVTPLSITIADEKLNLGLSLPSELI
ncbi:MAG TPA: hypothetical protein PLL08_05430, partial [Bacteroidales bacterium]|nr:hypothetical protein [Bacteroidales bacterium]